jgi:phosphoacetylglucosamine mutase
VSHNSLQLPVVITKTGVKHLHHAALEFDIGIYFEANGHGTVLFSERYHQVVAAASNKNPILSALPKLIHPAVGDALSDMLLIDVMLQSLHCWTLQDWNGKLYTDLPSRQLKVKVEDRLLVQCNENETKCLHPATLQPALDQAMASVPNGRAFVRASGTKNVVRVYAEAATRDQADKLATQVAKLVHELCGGVGPSSAI